MNAKRKKAIFTIDDSPTKFTIEKLEILEKRNIPTLLFCRGDLMLKHPDIVIDAIKRGFIIGNHSFSHPKFSTISTEECLLEIERTDKIIEDFYRQADTKWNKKYFRYPYGTKGDITYLSHRIWLKWFDPKFQALERKLKELNYVPLKIPNPKLRYPELLRLSDTDSYWTLDIREWKLLFKNSWKIEDVHDFINKKLSGSFGNEILLMHDHEETHAHFEGLVDRIVSKKYDFLTIP